MSSESNFSFTTKIDGDLYTVRADDIDSFEVNLQHAATAIAAINALQNAARGLAVVPPTVVGRTLTGGADVLARTFNATPVSSQPVPNPVAAPPVQVSNFGAPPSAPTCAHGPRKHKSGTAKSGKPYSAWFCQSQGTDKCEPEWGPAR